jgi:ABC-type Na+ efflux pump permease subunit
MALSPSLTRLIAALGLAVGLYFLRVHGHAYRIPQFDIAYGVPLLRAAVVYFVVALLLRARPQKQVAIVAAVVCALVEVSKLSHTPALDIFRLTEAGAWLMGRAFSWWSFLAYAAGLAVALGLDALLLRFSGQKSRGRRR